MIVGIRLQRPSKTPLDARKMHVFKPQKAQRASHPCVYHCAFHLQMHHIHIWGHNTHIAAINRIRCRRLPVGNYTHTFSRAKRSCPVNSRKISNDFIVIIRFCCLLSCNLNKRIDRFFSHSDLPNHRLFFSANSCFNQSLSNPLHRCNCCSYFSTGGLGRESIRYQMHFPNNGFFKLFILLGSLLGWS